MTDDEFESALRKMLREMNDPADRAATMRIRQARLERPLVAGSHDIADVKARLTRIERRLGFEPATDQTDR